MKNDNREIKPDTCQWLVRHKMYQDWVATDKSLLWIRGKAGSGKSTLARYVQEKRQDLFPKELLVLSFFFHDRGEGLQLKTLGLLRSLLHQILFESPEALVEVTAEFENRCAQDGEVDTKWNWDLEEMWHHVRSSLRKVLKQRPVCLIVDAIDQCVDRSQSEIVQKLQDLLNVSPTSTSKFHLLLTSRGDIDWRPANCFKICVEQENREALLAYIMWRLPDNFKSWSEMVDDAQGMFLWLRLTTSQVLQDNIKPETILKNTKNRPQSIDGFYRRIIQDQKKNADFLRLVQWICFAHRLPSLDELQWGMIVDEKSSGQPLAKWREASRYSGDNFEAMVKSLGGGIVEITNDKFVRFIHRSVKHFFLDGGLAELRESVYGIQKPTKEEAIRLAHYDLMRTCVRYLTASEIVELDLDNVEDSTSSFPLLRYATCSVMEHAKKSEVPGRVRSDLLEWFEWPSTSLINRWAKLVRIVDPWSACSTSERSETTLVHVFSRYGLESALRATLGDKSVFREHIRHIDGGGQMALSVAAGAGQLGVVRMLLNSDCVDINAKDKRGWTALSHAAAAGHSRIVNLIADRSHAGAQKALFLAADRNHAGVIKELLKPKVPVEIKIDDKDIDGNTALFLGVRKGYTEVVKVLLKSEADVGALDRKNRTVLMAAAWAGHLGVVRQLANDPRIRADSRDKNGHTALMMAAQQGQLEIFEFLLGNNPAQLDEKDNSGCTVFSQAAQRGQISIVKWLIQRGSVNVNSQDYHGRTPLSLATTADNLDMIELLLKDGEAHVDLADNDRRTPLVWAVKGGQADVVRLLLRYGAKADAPGENKKTALHHAASKGHAEVVWMLLESGASIAARDEEEMTALHYAAWGGHTEVVQGLIKRGLDVGARDKGQRTALHYAAWGGCREVVQKLLENGANVNDQDYNWDTAGILAREMPFSLAAEYGPTDTVALPPDRDRAKGIEAKDNKGMVPLMLAARAGRVEVVKLLLDRGAKSGVNDKDGRGVLTHAVVRGHEAVVFQILKRWRNTRPGSIELVEAYAEARRRGYVAIATLIKKSGISKGALPWKRAKTVAAAEGRRRRSEQATAKRRRMANSGAPPCPGVNFRDAAKKGDLAQVQELLDAKIINLADEKGYTALSWAARRGHVDVVQCLLDNQADVNSQNTAGETALLLAVEYSKPQPSAASDGHLEIVKKLLGASANANTEDHQGRTALLQAVRDGRYDIVEHLFTTTSLSVDIEDDKGYTALSTAARKGFSEIVAILLKRGRAGVRGDTIAMVRAAQERNFDIVQLLMENMEEVDINVVDERGRTAISYAAQFGSDEIVGLLLDHKADIDIKDKEGYTAAWWAKNEQHKPVLRALRTYWKATRSQRVKVPT